jgi:endoglucanase
MSSLLRRACTYSVVAILVAGVTSVAATASKGTSRQLSPNTQFFVPEPDRAAVEQIASLRRSHDRTDAELLQSMIDTPQAVWFTSGTPEQVQDKVGITVRDAMREDAVPVLVAYDIPGRDCAQFSAGGALNQAAYLAWIDGFAKGIGRGKAIVVLEPDSLGLLPSSCGGPKTGYPFTDSERFAELVGAVSRLEQQPDVSVYLDATHSAWLAVGDIASRLVQAGVQNAQGFFVNVSNFQLSANLVQYATWISDCIAFGNDPEQGGWRLGHYNYCASQYYPTLLSPYSVWGGSATAANNWYAANMGTATATTHFVIDTSRNGQGPNNMAAFAASPYNQPSSVVSALQSGNWCNPPGAGLGLQPTANTGVALLDAYLWVKTPGQSDGQCDAAGGVRAWDYGAYSQPGWPVAPSQQVLFDPLWGRYDPAAGAWFPQQALQLAKNANPALKDRPGHDE